MKLKSLFIYRSINNSKYQLATPNTNHDSHVQPPTEEDVEGAEVSQETSTHHRQKNHHSTQGRENWVRDHTSQHTDVLRTGRDIVGGATAETNVVTSGKVEDEKNQGEQEKCYHGNNGTPDTCKEPPSKLCDITDEVM